jgi:pimeloyl-ACP methyl ester carboxylesterase
MRSAALAPLVDLRGTGLSGAPDCPALHRTVAHYVLRAGRCAAQLGPRRDLYDTHAAADDLAAVLDALQIAKVDLYGDSYGSYAAQVFAARHSDRLRSLVLDGTYPVPGTDPALGDPPRRRSARCGSCARGGRPAPRAARIAVAALAGTLAGRRLRARRLAP